MKERILFAFIFIVILVSSAYASEINVTVDGERIVFTDQTPALVGGRTLVPVRAVFEAIGFTVGWDEATQMISLTRGRDSVQLTIGRSTFVVNGEPRALDVPAQIIGGRTMLPIRAVLESVGYYVGWDAQTQTVQILSEPPPAPAQIVIPNRRLTESEISAWIAAYGSPTEFEREVIRLVNIERAAANLSPLVEDSTLMMSARFKAQSLNDLDYFSHTNPVYGAFQNISFEVFNIPTQTIAENLARGHRTPAEVVHGWMNSDGHRENILNPDFTRIGVGYFNNNWAQKFLR
jgi:uncharacterized protein YkwD